MTLTTMTRKVKDNKGTASVIGGAIAGLVLSIILAITFVETLGNSGILLKNGSGIRYRCGHINVYRWCLDAQTFK